MLHGLLMTFSWTQMLGRTMVTNPFTSFSSGCWTYPAYKNIDGPTIAVDSKASPAFPMDNGLFLVVITVPTVLIILGVALITTYCFAKNDLSKTKSVSNISPQNSESLNN